MADFASVRASSSTLPSTCAGVVCIGDTAIELNNVTAEWHNVYDGTTYVCTVLNVSGVALVMQDPSFGDDSTSKALQTLLGNNYSTTAKGKSLTAPIRDVYHSFITDRLGGLPSSSSFDSFTDAISAMGLNAADVRGNLTANSGTPSTAVIPPASFALLVLPGVISGISLRPIRARKTTFESLLSNCGVYIPGFMMFRPIEINTVRISNLSGEDTYALGISINVYFCANPTTPGILPNESWRAPAYHKWSVGSSWNVGSKPRVTVSGRIVSRSVAAGPPSIYEFLPRTVPGMTLVSLNVSGDQDGKMTSYTAIYEVDYYIPFFFSNNEFLLSQKVAQTAASIAYVDIVEEAQSVVQGSAAVSTMYETQLNKVAQDMSAMANLAGLQAGMTGAQLDAEIARRMLPYATGGAVSGGLKRVGESIRGRIGAALKRISDLITGSSANLTTSGQQAAVQTTSTQMGTALRHATSGAQLGELVAHRYATQIGMDMKALEMMNNTVVRTVSITVAGFPGGDVADLQLAAYAIAKQVFFGWLAMGSPPVPAAGFILSGVINQDLVRRAGDRWNQFARDTRSLFPNAWPTVQSSFTNMYKIDMSVFSSSATATNNLFTTLTGLMGLTTDILNAHQNINVTQANLNQNIEEVWGSMMDSIWKAYTTPETYSSPRMSQFLTGLGRRHNIQNQGSGNPMASLLTYGADDVMSLALSLLGIRSVKAHVSVKHTVPMVTLNLVVAFGNIEYQGNVTLQSLWRCMGEPHVPLIDTVDGNRENGVPGIGGMIPFIIPITNYGAYRSFMTWITNLHLRKAYGFFLRELVSPGKGYGTFVHHTDTRGKNDTLLKKIFDHHLFRQSLGLSNYAHGGSVGTAQSTPSITFSYSRPGRFDYSSALGGGITTAHIFDLYSACRTYMSQQAFDQPITNVSTNVDNIVRGPMYHLPEKL